MAPVQLAIVQPADGAVLLNPATQLVGQLISAPPELAGVPLHYRWYSSLFPADEDRISINEVGLSDPATPLPYALGYGRNVLSLAASDKEPENQLTNSLHGGVAGGSDGPTRCVVTFLRAAVVAPLAGATLSRASTTLVAEAPVRADDEDHAEADRLRYHWRFTPQPADSRATVTVSGPPLAGDSGAFATLVFEAGAGSTGRVARYSGALPSAIGLGAYQLRLRVESADDPALGAEVTRSVVIAA
jgi:hypothetical protein